MKLKLMNNFGLKLLSVVIAILFWLVVVNVDDPVETQTYSGIRVTMVNESAITDKGKVYKVEDNSDVISVSVSARRKVHRSLTSADFVATADMEKDIQFGDLVAINVTCTNRNVKTEDIKKSRNNVKVSIEDSATEDFNVVVKQVGSPGSGYMVGEMVPERRVISVTGPVSLIERIRRIEAEVDVTGRTSDDTVNCNLKILNSDGDMLDTTYLQYMGKTTGMTVKLTMLRTRETRLVFGVSGSPAPGCVYTGLSFKPELVEIAGTLADIRGLTEIRIPDEAVSIEGLSETQEIEVDITPYLPDGIRLVDEAADSLVVVTPEIEQRQTRSVSIPVTDIILTGIPQGFSVSFGDLEAVQVPVSGLESDLAELDVDAIRVTLDVSSIKRAGEYKRALQIELPEGDCEAESATEVEFELQKGSAGLGNTGE